MHGSSSQCVYGVVPTRINNDLSKIREMTHLYDLSCCEISFFHNFFLGGKEKTMQKQCWLQRIP